MRFQITALAQARILTSNRLKNDRNVRLLIHRVPGHVLPRRLPAVLRNVVCSRWGYFWVNKW